MWSTRVHLNIGLSRLRTGLQNGTVLSCHVLWTIKDFHSSDLDLKELLHPSCLTALSCPPSKCQRLIFCLSLCSVLDGLGFAKSDWEKKCSEFSGGWQMRIALARLLLSTQSASQGGKKDTLVWISVLRLILFTLFARGPAQLQLCQVHFTSKVPFVALRDSYILARPYVHISKSVAFISHAY
jgi:hypothetical protein